MQALALADDTTGALEIGAQLAQAGVCAKVMLEAAGPWADAGDSPAVVVDADTRHLGAEAAHRLIRRLAAEARRLGVPYVYLKTDSTLRGPIGAEFQALLEVWPERVLVWVPAYPALGRQVIEGRLLVEGRPLESTAFAQDPLEPARESSLLRLLEGSCTAPVRLARTAGELGELLRTAPEGAVLVCDGREAADLQGAAEVLAAATRPALVAGTGGFAGPWVRRLPLPREYKSCPPAGRRWLIVGGSLHPRSREQLERCGLPRAAWPWQDLPDSPWVLLAPPPLLGAPLEAAARIGEAAAAACRRSGAGGLVVFGGDTARATLGALGEKVVEPCGELLAGIPLSRLPRTGLWLVSKAGGFGPPDVLTLIRKELERGT